MKWGSMRVSKTRGVGGIFCAAMLLILGCAVEPVEVTEGGEGAEEDVRDATQNAVIQISTLAQLRTMSGSGTYELTGDINASTTSTTPFVPIGTQLAPFTGSFNGKSFKITNLKIAGNRNYAGMFGFAAGATIQNVRLANVTLVNGSSYTHTGALVGNLVAGTVQSVQADGIVSGGSETGGLVGRASSESTISSSQTSSLIVSGTTNVGGVVGHLASSSLANCSTSGGSVTGGDGTGGVVGRATSAGANYSSAAGVNVTGTSNTGGFVGYSSGSLYYDSVSGQVQGGTKTGGLVGQLLEGSAFFDSASNMTVSGTSETGGLVGSLVRGTVDTGSVSGTITGTTYTGGIVGRMSGSSARRALLSKSYIDDRSGNNQSTVQGGTPVGMAVGRAESYSDLKQSYALGKVTGSSTKVGGFAGEVYAPGLTSVGVEPRAILAEIFTKVEVSPTFDNTNSSVFAGGLVGYMLGGDVQNINVAGSVKGRVYVGGAIGYVMNSGANVTSSLVRSVQTRGEVTNVATANRSGVIGGASGLFGRCTGNYWDSTTDTGTAPPLAPGEDTGCQLGLTSTQLKSPVRQYLDINHPNGNYEAFVYGSVITRAAQQAQGLHECQIGSGSDGDWGFGFCVGLIQNPQPLVWLLNSSVEYHTLVNIPRPERQPKS